MSLKISISGVRGIYGNSLTDEICLNFTLAFTTLIKSGSIVVGMDPRPSSEKIKKLVIKTLIKQGFTVYDIGIAPTPTVGITVRNTNAKGGIVITASHNPEEWNGLKFMQADGTFLDSIRAQELFELYDKHSFIIKNKLGKLIKYQKQAYKLHINKIIENINLNRIKKRKFKVALDSVNGAGSYITKQLLKKLGCKVVTIFTNPKNKFLRGAEPTPSNLVKLCQLVKKNKAQIGFAQDPDADRLAIVDEKGHAICEEYTLVISALSLLKSSKAKNNIIVANLSTTAALDDIASTFNAKVIRTKVGEAHVVKAIINKKALIGGEGNGGVIYPKINLNRDSLAGIALILDYLSIYSENISSLYKKLPIYYSAKLKIDAEKNINPNTFIDYLINKYQKNNKDLSEGIKIFFGKSWVHIRPSNTEPIIRVIAEAPSKKEANRIANLIIKDYQLIS